MAGLSQSRSILMLSTTVSMETPYSHVILAVFMPKDNLTSLILTSQVSVPRFHFLAGHFQFDILHHL